MSRSSIRAHVLGATLGQGWWWGRPDRGLVASRYSPERFAARPADLMRRTTPFDVVRAARLVRRAPKRLLLPLSQTLELAAMQARVPPLLLSAFEHARHFTPATAVRYTALADRLPLVCALGEDMPAAPAVGVRGAALSSSDPLAREWTVVMLGAHESAALIGHDCGDDGSDRDREFDFVVTHDRALVTAAARALVGRLPRDATASRG